MTIDDIRRAALDARRGRLTSEVRIYGPNAQTIAKLYRENYCECCGQLLPQTAMPWEVRPQ